MAYRGGAQWLATAPKPARREIRRIINEAEGADFAHRRTAYFYRWAVRLTPSVGTAEDVVLIAYSEFSRREWHVLCKGELVKDAGAVRRRNKVAL
jgi:hypothetical protein